MASIETLSPVPGKKTILVETGGEQFEVAAALAERLELRPGMPVTPAMRKQLQAAAQRRAAAAQALRYLSGRARTEREVRDHLLARDHDDLAVTAVVEELRVEGLLDDERYASWYVEARLAHRPTGSARLVHEMVGRGVPREVADRHARAGVEARDERSLALAAARKRLPSLRGLDKDRALRRLASFLTGRGFRQETVRSVCFALADGGALGARHESDDQSES